MSTNQRAGCGALKDGGAPTLVLDGLTVPSLPRAGHSAPAHLDASPRAAAVCVSHPEVGQRRCKLDPGLKAPSS